MSSLGFCVQPLDNGCLERKGLGAVSLQLHYFFWNCHPGENDSQTAWTCQILLAACCLKSIVGKQVESFTDSFFSSNCLINTVTTWPGYLVESRQVSAVPAWARACVKVVDKSAALPREQSLHPQLTS